MRRLKKAKNKSKYLECEHRDSFFLWCQVWPIRDTGTGWSLFEVGILYGRTRTVSRAGPRILIFVGKGRPHELAGCADWLYQVLTSYTGVTLETHVTPSTWLHQSKAILSRSIAPLFRTSIILLKTAYSSTPCTDWKVRGKGLSLVPIWACKTCGRQWVSIWFCLEFCSPLHVLWSAEFASEDTHYQTAWSHLCSTIRDVALYIIDIRREEREKQRWDLTPVSASDS